MREKEWLKEERERESKQDRITEFARSGDSQGVGSDVRWRTINDIEVGNEVKEEKSFVLCLVLGFLS